MAYTILSTDVTTTQTIASTNDRFTLSREGSIHATSLNGLVAATNVYNTKVQIYGEVIAEFSSVFLSSEDALATGIGGHEVLIGAEALVSGNTGVHLIGSSNDVINNGVIQSYGFGIYYNGNNVELANAGTIQSMSTTAAIVFGTTTTSGTTLINNSGLIMGVGGVAVYNENLELINSGTIDSINGTALSLANDGFVLDFVNYGIISTTGLNAIYTQDGDDSVTNHGTVTGDIILSNGENTFTNTDLVNGSYYGGNDTDIVTNSGHIGGTVYLLNSNDIFDGRGGAVESLIYGGAGDDTYYVADTKHDLFEHVNEGTDIVFSVASRFKLAANFENLTLIGDGDNRGIGNGEANIILGNIGDNRLRGKAGNDSISGDDGDDMILGGGNNDVLRGDDVIRGDAGTDILYGDDDNDLLLGNRHNDLLYGGRGDDQLVGGLGFDQLFGGAGEDSFIFNRKNDSPDTADADKILDFVTGEDVIDLRGLAGELSYIGTAGFSNTAGEVQAISSGSITRVKVDLNGDGAADMKIMVIGTIDLSDGDFML